MTFLIFTTITIALIFAACEILGIAVSSVPFLIILISAYLFVMVFEIYSEVSSRYKFKEVEEESLEEFTNGIYYVKDCKDDIVVLLEDDETGENVDLTFNKHIVHFEEGEPSIEITYLTKNMPKFWTHFTQYGNYSRKIKVVIRTPKQ